MAQPTPSAAVRPTIVLELDDCRRPLCPRCGGYLYARIQQRASGVIPYWAGADGVYHGFDADPDEGSHCESEMLGLYCERCQHTVDLRQADVAVRENPA